MYLRRKLGAWGGTGKAGPENGTGSEEGTGHLDRPVVTKPSKRRRPFAVVMPQIAAGYNV
ncbi:protein of unknown function [Kyrpidia spormannii]|uniref:Uncharacterized protein n=1 Tax=Kyrpidia spormannii TaxID=2055160 RepID=A0A6F9EHS1_9BACL|nr:protein of unknown function [Kyrpidia spormannii]